MFPAYRILDRESLVFSALNILALVSQLKLLRNEMSVALLEESSPLLLHQALVSFTTTCLVWCGFTINKK